MPILKTLGSERPPNRGWKLFAGQPILRQLQVRKKLIK